MTYQITDDPNYVEKFPDGEIFWYLDRQQAHIKSPKRSETIICYNRHEKYAYYGRRYDSGKPVADFGDGTFLSLGKAVEAVKNWLASVKQSDNAKKNELHQLRQERAAKATKARK